MGNLPFIRVMLRGTMRITLILPALAACAALSACATPAYVSPVEVTRFTGDGSDWLGHGTIQVAPAPGMEVDSITFAIYQEALRTQLEQLGYRVVLVNGDQVAQLGLDEAVAAPRGGRGPVSVGVGGSTGGFGSGVGMGIGFDLGSLSGPPADRIERTVSVAIRQASGGQNLWEGRASMVATSNSDFASDATAAPRIVQALFSGFPGQSGETIAVE
ncbi:MAG: DUF4136 domain-containing protein [Erythrobacter sp.]|nr:DUF4136 domain-containing protein [Erythrobacter sp.]